MASAQETPAPAEKKWVPPATIEELYAAAAGNQFSGINRPTAGPRNDDALPRGEAPFQLYSLATPNGQKVGILLEELGIPYDAHLINIGSGEQFSAGFIGACPNNKIPAAIDYDGPGGQPIALMESAAIMLYLAEKFPEKGFLPTDPRLKSEVMQWLFWQMSTQGPMTGNYGHFMVYAPADKTEARDYGVARYGMEVQRCLDLLDKHLQGFGDFRGGAGLRPEGPRTYLVDETYTIADMICFPWVNMLRGPGYDREGQPRAQDFLGLSKYTHVSAWVDRVAAREAVQKGLAVCKWQPKA